MGLIWLGQLNQISVPEKRLLQTKQKPNQPRIAYLGIRLRLKVHFVSDKLSFHFMKTLYYMNSRQPWVSRVRVCPHEATGMFLCGYVRALRVVGVHMLKKQVFTPGSYITRAMLTYDKKFTFAMK